MTERLDEIKRVLGDNRYNLLVNEAEIDCLGRKVETDHNAFVREYIEKNYRKFVLVSKIEGINAS